MSKKNIKVLYDKKSKVLSVEIGRGKSADSDIQGNVVIDYDKKGRIVRLNLYDFSFDDFRETRPALRSFSHHIGAVLTAK